MYDSPEELLGKIRLGEDTPLELKAVDFRGQRVHEPARDDLADEIAAIEVFVRSAAIGCINVPSGAGKMEIPAQEIHPLVVGLRASIGEVMAHLLRLTH